MTQKKPKSRAKKSVRSKTAWNRETVLPFAAPSVFWLMIGGMVSLKFEDLAGLKIFLIVAFLGLFDLFVLGKTIAFLTALVSSRGTVQRADHIRGTILWGSLKLSALFALLGVLFWGRELPRLGLFLGYATLIFLPFAGGVIWGYRNRNLD